MKHILTIISLSAFSIFSLSSALAEPQLNDIINAQQSNADIEALVAQHDLQKGPAWLEVTSNAQGTVAFASAHKDMLDLDFTAGADLGQVYYAPSADSNSKLEQGFYTLRLSDDPVLGVAALLLDQKGQVAQLGQAEVKMMTFSPESANLEHAVEVVARMNSFGELEAAAHGDCWLVGSGGSAHGRCWITIVPIIEEQ